MFLVANSRETRDIQSAINLQTYRLQCPLKRRKEKNDVKLWRIAAFGFNKQDLKLIYSLPALQLFASTRFIIILRNDTLAGVDKKPRLVLLRIRIL